MEWDDLVKSAGGNKAGKALKSSSGWNNRGNGTDKYSFSALPGGYRHSDGHFYNAAYNGYWWAATEDDAGNADFRYMNYDGNNVYSLNNYKSYASSVRCVGD
jgi:uncharacterized protein (TIGR02145 family)